MKVTPISTEDLRSHQYGQQYNAEAWNLKIDGFLKRFSEVEFFIAEPCDTYRYVRFFTRYVTPDNIRFFASFRMSAGLTTAPFNMIRIEPGTGELTVLKSEIKNVPACRPIIRRMSMNVPELSFTNEF